MKTKPAIALLFALTVAVMGVLAAEGDMEATENPAMGAAGLVTTTATVTAIDRESREVTLMGGDGEAFTISVGDEVKNLAQVNVGDQVNVAYYEAVTVELLDADQARPDVAATESLNTAAPGEKPGALATSEMAVVATVKGIDKEAGTATLMGPEGNTRTVKVRNPENLEKVAIDDRILITLTRAVAVGVTEVPKGG